MSGISLYEATNPLQYGCHLLNVRSNLLLAVPFEDHASPGVA